MSSPEPAEMAAVAGDVRGAHDDSEREIALATEKSHEITDKMEATDRFDASKVENASGVDTPDSATLEGSESSQRKSQWAVIDAIYRGISWTPRTCRYDPENPPKFSLAMNFLFAFATTITVANLYYNQSILNKMAETFQVSFERASSVATLMQAGYASGLLLICPLGDIFRRRPFILLLIAFTATLWIALCTTKSFTVFAGISFICGMTTVTPQLMLPLVGDLAPPHRRASSLAIVVSGLSLGMLIARLLSGIIANYTDWRNIYWFAFAAQYLVFFLLYWFMPDYPSKNPDGLNYFRMMWTIVQLLFTEPVLVQACLIAFLTSAVFTSYWTTLSFLLSSPPYSYPSLTIGLFSLIGIFIICWGPIYSRLIIDKIQPLYSSMIGLILELVGTIVGTFIGDFTVAGPIIQAVVIDLGNQACNIANRTAIYHIQPNARNRVNTCYMLAAFCGQLTGTAVGNRLYAQGGWVWSGSCSIAFIAFALVVSFARGPREKRWIGWRGGWGIWRDDLPRKDAGDNSGIALEQASRSSGEQPR